MIPESLLPGHLQGLGGSLAVTLGVPYIHAHADSRREAPECFMNVDQALERLGDKTLIGVYAHNPTLTIVLVTDDDKIGIRLSCLDKGYPTLVRSLAQRRTTIEA